MVARLRGLEGALADVEALADEGERAALQKRLELVNRAGIRPGARQGLTAHAVAALAAAAAAALCCHCGGTLQPPLRSLLLAPCRRAAVAPLQVRRLPCGAGWRHWSRGAAAWRRRRRRLLAWQASLAVGAVGCLRAWLQ